MWVQNYILFPKYPNICLLFCYRRMKTNCQKAHSTDAAWRDKRTGALTAVFARNTPNRSISEQSIACRIVYIYAKVGIGGHRCNKLYISGLQKGNFCVPKGELLGAKSATFAL